MDSTRYLDKAIIHTLVSISFFMLPDLPSILIDATHTENLKDYSVSIFVMMNYLCYIMSLLFFLSSINNICMYLKHHKKGPVSTVRAQIKIPTQNKKEAPDKIVNF